MTHRELLQAVFPLFLRVLQADQSLRPTFITALAFWLAPRDGKLAFRPSKQSRYPILLRVALANATKEEKDDLKEIIRLGTNFLPLEP